MTVATSMEAFSINRILPDLPDEMPEKLVDALTSLGATDSNLHMVQESDLAGVIPVLTARELIIGWKSLASGRSPSLSSTEPATSEHSDSDCVLPKLQSSGNAEPGWPYRFIVPWESFPKALLECCEDSKVPHPTDRREMIRILADSIMKVQPNVTRKSVEPIAHSLIVKYSKSFMDMADGIPMGSGHSSLTNQLVNGIQNCRKTQRSRKRQVEPATSSTFPFRPTWENEYGCIR